MCYALYITRWAHLGWLAVGQRVPCGPGTVDLSPSWLPLQNTLCASADTDAVFAFLKICQTAAVLEVGPPTPIRPLSLLLCLFVW
jgi:hypothetical protein